MIYLVVTLRGQIIEILRFNSFLTFLVSAHFYLPNLAFIRINFLISLRQKFISTAVKQFMSYSLGIYVVHYDLYDLSVCF